MATEVGQDILDEVEALVGSMSPEEIAAAAADLDEKAEKARVRAQSPEYKEKQARARARKAALNKAIKEARDRMNGVQ